MAEGWLKYFVFICRSLKEGSMSFAEEPRKTEIRPGKTATVIDKFQKEDSMTPG